MKVIMFLFLSFLIFAILSVWSIVRKATAFSRKFNEQQRAANHAGRDDASSTVDQSKVFAKDEGEYVSYEELNK